MYERTLLLVKHDGVIRGLIGEILHRFEKIGLKIIGLKMLWADERLAENHYLLTDEWANALYARTKEAKEKSGQPFPYPDAKHYAHMIQSWNKKFLMVGPVVAVVLEGPHAVELGRKMVGHTEPRQALPGTIRGDYTFDSYHLSDAHQRPIRNLVHASGTIAEAQREIALWFESKELYTYPTSQSS